MSFVNSKFPEKCCDSKRNLWNNRKIIFQKKIAWWPLVRNEGMKLYMGRWWFIKPSFLTKGQLAGAFSYSKSWPWGCEGWSLEPVGFSPFPGPTSAVIGPENRPLSHGKGGPSCRAKWTRDPAKAFEPRSKNTGSLTFHWILVVWSGSFYITVYETILT